MSHSFRISSLTGINILARRFAFSLLFFAAWLMLVQAIEAGSGTFSNTGSLVEGRFTHTATLLPNGKVLVAGGYNHLGVPVASAELYDPASGTWTATGNLGGARGYHTATLLPNGKVLVSGGRDALNVSLASAELYDPASGTWMATGSLATAHGFLHTATLLPNGKVLVVGGRDGNEHTLASAELYDPASGTWTATGSLATGHSQHTATLLVNGKVLVAGGANDTNSALRSVELYDPASGTWTVTGDLGIARRWYTAILLPNGKVLATGGYNGNGDFLSAELYDPASGTWTATGSLAIGRGFLHTATLLPNGKVLVAGGEGVPAGTSAELYDPASGTWATTGNLAIGRSFHTATLLPNGKVLVAAGQNNSVVGLASAELYNGGQGPTPTPSQGGLSETLFTVNGSTSPTIVPDSVVLFRATQTAIVAQLFVRVQAATVLNPQEADWTDLPDGNGGRMVFDESSNAYVHNTTGYPLTNNVSFRAISAAPGFGDSISNVIGTFNLVSSTTHLGPTHLLVDGSESASSVTPGASIHFDATQPTDTTGLAVRIQWSTTPGIETGTSWTDLPGGGLAALGNQRYAGDSIQYSTGDTVYFRAHSSAPGALDSLSNEIGPFVLVADTPPSVIVVPPAGQPGSGSGQDADHPILLFTGTFSFGANTTGPRQVVSLALLYDGDTLDRFNGDHGTVQYTTNVPGDHVMEAFAKDDLGGIGNAHPVYVRILPRDAKIFFMVNSGDWSTATNWIDTHGDTGIPGANDMAVVGASSASLSQDVTVGATFLSGGTITGPNALTVAVYFCIASGTLDNLNLTIGPHATLDLANDGPVGISGTITNNGRLTYLGTADIIGVPHGAAAAAARTQGNDPALLNQVFAAIRNFGQFIFQRPKGGHTSGTSNRTVHLHALVNAGGRVISNDGGSVVSHDGASVVSHDGGSIRFHSNANSSGTPGGSSSFDFTQTGGETDLTDIGITGSVLINGGTLTGTGTITGNLTNNGGFIAPGHSPGIIAVTGNFIQGAQGMLILEDGGAAPSLFDQLQIGGTATLGGSLDVRAINNYQPSATIFFNPLSYSSASGSFSSVSSNATITLGATGALATDDSQLPQPSVGQPLNISTRLQIQNGENVLIAGFIITGPSGSTKQVLIRGIGPSLANLGVPGTIADPFLELHKSDGSIVTNDNWQEASNAGQIPSGFAPTNDLESAIYTTLAPGSYTAILKGAHGETGIGLAEVYDFEATSTAKLANIATRGFVDTGDNVMIGGFIIGGTEPAKVLVRAIGPSLTGLGVQGALQDTSLELHDQNGSVFSNEGWRSTQEAEIIATTIPPSNDRESAILATLVPGSYTAIVRGRNDTTGIAVVEAYNLR